MIKCKKKHLQRIQCLHCTLSIELKYPHVYIRNHTEIKGGGCFGKVFLWLSCKGLKENTKQMGFVFTHIHSQKSFPLVPFIELVCGTKPFRACWQQKQEHSTTTSQCDMPVFWLCFSLSSVRYYVKCLSIGGPLFTIPICPPLPLSSYITVFPYVSLSVFLSFSLYLSDSLSVPLSMSVPLSLSLSVSICLTLSSCLSVSLSIFNKYFFHSWK